MSPTFSDGKGNKRFHMNPQAGKKMFNGGAAEENAEEKIAPGIHEKVAEKLGGYDGHEHNGKPLAHHVEMHHGGHEQGQPAQHEGTSHHTVHHPHDGGEPEVHNHDSYEEASQDQADSMHDGCPECESEGETDDGASDDQSGAENEQEEY